jgi:hypothetical protein
MDALRTMAFLTNAPRELWPHALESVLSEASALQGPRFMVLPFEPDANPPRNALRLPRDDPMSRYADWTGPSKSPYLTAREAASFFQDAAKPKYLELASGRTLVLVLSPRDMAVASPCVDSLCFFMMRDHSSIPFVYEAIKAIRPGEFAPPAWMAIVGESRIENAASFFVSAERELKELGGDNFDLSFAGCIDFDRDELDLAISFDKPFLQAFPMGATQGQAKFIAKRIIAQDRSSRTIELPKRLRDLTKLCEDRAFA